MASFLDIATTVCIGLLIGTEFAVSVFVNPVLWRLDRGAQARAISLFARRLGRAMPFWYGLSLLLLIYEAVLRRHAPGSFLLATACGIWAAVSVLSIFFLVPINNRMARLESDSFSQQRNENIGDGTVFTACACRRLQSRWSCSFWRFARKLV